MATLAGSRVDQPSQIFCRYDLSGAGGAADFFVGGLGGCAMADRVRASRHNKTGKGRFMVGFLSEWVRRFGGILAHHGAIRKRRIDRFPPRTLEWLSLPVLADPFWGGSPWLQAPWRKTQQAWEVQREVSGQARGYARVRRVAFGELTSTIF